MNLRFTLYYQEATYMKIVLRNILGILLILFVSSCASVDVIVERKKEEQAALEQLDHEECLSYGFTDETEAYGGCRLTLKSIRAQEKNTDALRTRNSRDSLHNRFYYCRGFYCW
jgi:hypothetical protein